MILIVRLASPGALALLLATGCSQSAASGPPPPIAVSTVTVTPETVPLSSEWIATLDGFVNAQIRPQVTGYLIRRNYDEGSAIKKGQVVFEIDPRTFQAALAQAAAQVGQAQAELGRTEQNVARDSLLAQEGLIPKSQVDTDIQANLAAAAGVKSAEAARAIAQLNLGFTQVRSLVDGIAGIANAQIGDLVTPSTLLTTVSQVDPIKAYFSLSEQEYLGIADQINRPNPAKTLWEGDTPLTLLVGDAKAPPISGAFLAADREIDARTGTIRISAAFPNPNHVLRPGQYARVRAETQVLKNALLVPARAVSELQGRALLRVVGANNKVNVRTVTLGKRVGNRWVVAGGLEPNASVIVDAPQLTEGTVVKPRPAAAPL
jgi:membrane fusion protein (multidrug efflux system)